MSRDQSLVAMFGQQQGHQLPADAYTKFLEELKAGTLNATVTAAAKYAQSVISKTPISKSCPIRTHEEIKNAVGNAGVNEFVLFGGTLSMMALDVPSTRGLDTGRMGQLLQVANTHDLGAEIGQIIVNWHTCGETELVDMHRCNKDAEVVVLCLLLLWHRADDVLTKGLTTLATDLVLDAHAWGSGSQLSARKLPDPCGWSSIPSGRKLPYRKEIKTNKKYFIVFPGYVFTVL